MVLRIIGTAAITLIIIAVAIMLAVYGYALSGLFSEWPL